MCIEGVCSSECRPRPSCVHVLSLQESIGVVNKCVCVCVCGVDVCCCSPSVKNPSRDVGSLVPRLSCSLSHWNWRGRSVKIESLVHIVGACANYLGYHAYMLILGKISEVSVMGVYKITEIFKKMLLLSMADWNTETPYTWSIISKTSGNITNTMLRSVPSL